MTLPISTDVQVVSDIDFTICTPQKTTEPFYPKCQATAAHQCPITQLTDRYANRGGRCVTLTEAEFHVSMACPLRDAFSEEFYTWLATLDFEADVPIASTITYLKAQPNPIVLLTNRDTQCHVKTMQFMAKHRIPIQDLHMRPKGDFRPLWDFKLEKIAMLAQIYPKIIWLDDQKPPACPDNVTWVHPDQTSKFRLRNPASKSEICHLDLNR